MRIRETVLRRAAPVVLAAVVLLALIEVHTAIVRQALGLLGVGFAEPKVIMVADGCGHARWLPPALKAMLQSGDAPLQSDCRFGGDLVALLPTPGPAVAFVNGSPISPPVDGGRLAWFSHLRWIEGQNLVTVWGAGDRLMYPLAISSPADAKAYLMAGRLGDVDEDRMDQRVSAAIGALSPRLAIFRAHASGALPSASATAPPAPPIPPPVAPGTADRQLEIDRAADGTLHVRAEICVAPNHALARSSAWMKGPEFVAQGFGMLVAGPLVAASDPLWRSLPLVVAAPNHTAQECTRLRTEYEVPQGKLTMLRHPEFLLKKGDSLRLSGFGDALTIIGAPADEASGQLLLWSAREDRSDLDLFLFTSDLAQFLTPVLPALPSAAQHGAIPPRDRLGTTAEAVPAGPGRAAPSGLVASLRNLQELLPRAWRATAWALASAAPVALMLWALRRGWPLVPPALARPERVRRAHAGLVALLAFMGVFALQPLLLQLTDGLLGMLNIPRFVGLPVVAGLPRGGDLSAPLALCAALMVVPVLRGAEAPVGQRRHRLAAAFAGLAAVTLLVMALLVHVGIRWLPNVPQVGQELMHLSWHWLHVDRMDGPLATFLLLAAWAVAGLALFWTATYWMFRVAVSGAPVLGAALLAGFLLFVLPMTQGTADLAWIAAGATTRGSLGLMFLLPLMAVGDPALAFAAAFAGGFVVLVVAILLHALREVAAAMLDDAGAARLRGLMRTPWLLLLAIVIVWPMTNTSWADANMLHSVVYQLMSFFQAFGALLAIMALLAAAQEQDAVHRAARRDDRFSLPDALLGLVAAAFAGYLTLWNREPIAVALLIVVGWLTFRHAVLAPDEAVPAAPAGNLAKRLASHVAETRLLKARLTNLEKQFTEGKISLLQLGGQRERLERAQARQDEALGMPPEQARRRLFLHGPGATPLGNGLRAAGAGVAVGLVLQLLLQFEWASIGSKAKDGWLNIVGNFIVDPQYQVMGTGELQSRLLSFCGELLNALGLWAIAGFIFGYVFHRIRGRDGFMRGAVFGIAVSVPYLLSQALTADGQRLPTESLLRVVPLLVFLLAVGALLFDGATLRRQGVSMAKLPEVYGLKTSVGYVSFAGALAGVQPLLDLMGWISGK